MSIKKLSKMYPKFQTISLGKHTSQAFKDDPKHLAFSMSRYKFVSKMLEGYDSVAEIGAGDGFQSEIVRHNVKNLTLIDVGEHNKKDYLNWNYNPANYLIHNFIKKKLNKKFKGIYLIDVLEHIPKSLEKKFIKNIKHSLKKNGTVIIGMPSLESQKYASLLSKLGHVNCKNKYKLRNFLYNFFSNVYMFSMNDEVIHTGFDKMSNYIFAVCN